MLVVMHTSARSEQIETVCDLGRTAGLDPTVFDGDPDGPRKAENALVFRTQVNF